MVNKDIYTSAVNKIKASNKFKTEVIASTESADTRRRVVKTRRLVPVFIILLALICISASFMLSLRKDSAQINTSDGITSSDDFKIIEKTSGEEAEYMSVVYMDGYSYSPSEWLKYSRFMVGSESIRGEKLGEVTLDLKGINYTGTPPDFSSTHNVGTEIYAIKDMKKERAILVIHNDYASIFYRERKALLDDKTPINLTLTDVFNMLTDSLDVSAIELRSDEDGSWMRTSEDEKMLSMINRELPGLPLLNYSELGQDPYANDHSVLVNLMFKDGTALHMQVFPQEMVASVFGGFIRLSPEICKEVQKLSAQSEEYPSLSSMLTFKAGDLSYLHLINHTNGDEVLCKDPEWSREALFSIFNYYRMEEVEDKSGSCLVMTSTIGKSKDDQEVLEFYETDDKQIVVKLRGHTFKPVKGQITFDELESYLYNSTDIGRKE